MRAALTIRGYAQSPRDLGTTTRDAGGSYLVDTYEIVPSFGHDPADVPMPADQIIARGIGITAFYVRMLHNPIFAPDDIRM